MSREKSKFKFKAFQGFCYWLFSTTTIAPRSLLFRYHALILHLIHGANMAVVEICAFSAFYVDYVCVYVSEMD